MRKSELALTVLILCSLILGVFVGQFVLHKPVAAPFNAAMSELAEAGEQFTDTGELTDRYATEQQARTEALQERTNLFNSLGNLLFIRPLKMLVVPIVFVGVLVGVAGIGSADRLGVLGGATITYYLTTMAAAVIVGLVLVSVIQPGANAETASLDQQAAADFASANIESRISGRPESLTEILISLGEGLVSSNPVKSAAEGDTLALVVLGILIGLALVAIGEKGKPAIAFFDSFFEALIKLVMWIVWLAIPGIFCIVAGRVGQVGFDAFAGTLAKFSLVVILGLLIHALITLPTVLALFGRAKPWRFAWQMRKPLLTAFSTSSSAATLPITIEDAVESGGCSEKAANFVLPLGATVNMDGTALYIAVVVSFLFEIYGFDLSLAQYAIILFTATLAAVGTAAVPSASLVLMAIVIGAVNNTIPSFAPGKDPLPLHAIGIILGVDRLLDMCRTCVNVWGDSVGAKIITRLAPDDDGGMS